MGNYRLFSGALLASLSGLLVSIADAAPLSSAWKDPDFPSTISSADVQAAQPAAPVLTSSAPLVKSASDTDDQAVLTPASQGSPPSPLKVGIRRSESQETSVTSLYDHQMDGKSVTTLYLRDLPLVTFVAQPGQPSPLLQASSLAAQLNQLARTNPKVQEVTLEYQNPDYVITSNGQALVRFDNRVLMVGKDRASVALTATNRLRRLLLDAPPLASAPQPPKSVLPNPLQAAVNSLIGMRSVQEQRGHASFYTFAPKSPTAGVMTAAHRNLPFGTLVKVTNLANGQATVVKINDRGPFIAGRIIDLSYAAARAIGMIQSGVAPVKVEVLRPSQSRQ